MLCLRQSTVVVLYSMILVRVENSVVLSSLQPTSFVSSSHLQAPEACAVFRIVLSPGVNGYARLESADFGVRDSCPIMPRLAQGGTSVAPATRLLPAAHPRGHAA